MRMLTAPLSSSHDITAVIAATQLPARGGRGGALVPWWVEDLPKEGGQVKAGEGATYGAAACSTSSTPPRFTTWTRLHTETRRGGGGWRGWQRT